MRLTLSNAAKELINKWEIDAAFIQLLEISHSYPGLTSPLRIARNTVDITHNGYIYTGYQFQMAGSVDERENEIPKLQLIVDNTEQLLTPIVRALTAPADITYKVIVSSQPNHVQIGPIAFKLRAVKGDAMVLACDLTLALLLQMQWPFHRALPSTWPGAFGTP